MSIELTVEIIKEKSRERQKGKLREKELVNTGCEKRLETTE